MKLLNESNLVYFSTCSSQSTKEGWLYKKGEVNKNFQKRWFVLKGNLLFYFDKPGDREPNGVIILEGYTVELVDTAVEGHTFQIIFKGATNTRKYILQAESHEVMEQWMKVITCASYDYMKLMVAELKSQLDELTSQQLANELADCKQSSDTSDSFGQKPFAAASAQPTSVDSADGNQQLSEHKAKARHNPFDKNMAEPLDPFGLVPFEPQPASVHSSNSNSLALPQAPERKKKNSPKLLRKIANSPKLNRKTDDTSSKSKTQFYHPTTSEQQTLNLSLPSTIRASRFTELHSLYGLHIRRMLSKSVAIADNTASLIEF